VSKGSFDTKDISIIGPTSFVYVDVQSDSARVKFGQKNNDFELESEQIHGSDGEGYEVVLKIFSC
jgi:hypothetical protein